MKEHCGPGETDRAQILIVVVLYKMSLTESTTIQGLLQNFALDPGLHKVLSVLVWDNSPLPLENRECLSSFAYQHSEANIGVSGAYNRAMKIAEATGCQWLLLLDQDTVLPGDFLPQMFTLGCRFLDEPDIAAVVPVLMDGERVLSPRRVLFKRFKPLDQVVEGVYPEQVSAANSGSLMRIDALQQLGGFNEDYWLDFSDVVVYHLLHEQGKQVYIASNLRLKHKFSAIEIQNSMPPERYSNFIAAEGAYWDMFGTAAERVSHTLRIFERALRQKRRFENSTYAKITLAYFFRRLFTRKKYRLSSWKLASSHR